MRLSRTSAVFPAPDGPASAVSRPTGNSAVTSCRFLSALPQAYWVGGDTGLKQTTAAAWEGLDLVAEEIATIVPIPQSVFDDSTFNIWTELRDPIAASIGSKLDAAALLGIERPASWPPSVLEGATSAGNVAQAGATAEQGAVYSDLEAILGIVEDDGFAPDNYVGAPRLRRLLRQARNSLGDMLGEGSTNQAWDLPIAYTPLVAAPNLALVGDFQMLVCAIRQDITYTVATEGVISDDQGKVITNLLQQDTVALRVVFRAACAIANPATVENPDKASRYPFAVLADPLPPENGAADVDLAEGEPQSRRAAGKR